MKRLRRLKVLGRVVVARLSFKTKRTHEYRQAQAARLVLSRIIGEFASVGVFVAASLLVLGSWTITVARIETAHADEQKYTSLLSARIQRSDQQSVLESLSALKSAIEHSKDEDRRAERFKDDPKARVRANLLDSVLALADIPVKTSALLDRVKLLESVADDLAEGSEAKKDIREVALKAQTIREQQLEVSNLLTGVAEKLNTQVLDWPDDKVDKLRAAVAKTETMVGMLREMEKLLSPQAEIVGQLLEVELKLQAVKSRARAASAQRWSYPLYAIGGLGLIAAKLLDTMATRRKEAKRKT